MGAVNGRDPAEYYRTFRSNSNGIFFTYPLLLYRVPDNKIYKNLSV
jgi:hypothetical protein